MKYCTNCGHQLAEGAKFCDNCGTAVNAESSRKTVYEGEVHKCASCGEILKAFETVCPVCGNEVRGVKGSSCVKELSDKLESAKSEEQKIGIIKNFPIPNTKEDIYELFFLATSNFELDVYVRNISFEDQSDAWYALICRCYEAAKVCLKGQDEFAYIEEKYVAMNQKINKAVLKYRRKEKLKKNKVAIIIASSLLAVGLIGLTILLLLNPKIEVGRAESDMIGKNYTTVVNDLESKGFSNIETEPVYGTDTSKAEYLVVEVEINGSNDFSQDDKFYKEAEIIVRYYEIRKSNSEWFWDEITIAGDDKHTERIYTELNKKALMELGYIEIKVEFEFTITQIEPCYQTIVVKSNDCEVGCWPKLDVNKSESIKRSCRIELNNVKTDVNGNVVIEVEFTTSGGGKNEWVLEDWSYNAEAKK